MQDGADKQIDTEYQTVMQLHLTPVDETMPYRFVGSYEYGNCLKRFTRLAAISSPEEIEVYDEILNEHPEFTYYQGISTAFQSPPDMTKSNPDERSKFNDKFQKGGLAWMLALARIEYGATLSMYSNSFTPFADVVGDSSFGLHEYLDILVDDSAAHIKAMTTEKIFQEILDRQRSLDAWTLAYLRRLKVIKDMMLAISERADSQQLKPLDPYFQEIVKIEKTLSDSVKAATNRYAMGTYTESQFIEGKETRGAFVAGTNKRGKALTEHCKEQIERMNGIKSEPSQNESRH